MRSQGRCQDEAISLGGWKREGKGGHSLGWLSSSESYPVSFPSVLISPGCGWPDPRPGAPGCWLSGVGWGCLASPQGGGGLPEAALQGLVASVSPPVADVSDISRFLSVLQEPHAGLIQAARQLLSDERAPMRQKLLADLLGTVSENIAAETRAEDPPWFEGLESRFRNKSGYLRYSCESRIRSYLREVTSGASLARAEAREEYLRVVGAMGQRLQAARYNSSYFDRWAKAGRRLCTREGWFSCQGPFDLDDCTSRHSINPYSNRESRVLFSTWNLDHVIEKKRTVVPTLAAAVHDAKGREVDWEYFYRLFFTAENLKLVHIACHKKTTHKLHCDPSRIYRAPAAPRRKRPARQRP
ncbi:DNA fragmentation factor subunit beta isoform X1 [Hippopotamus amphibius kiboko]|uniref:DNA fragmentation factor subunit beta isoform X1 n=1 Tax=Hippopotamus amphibius kiboko TaxID=575201 RepID=UPI0025982D08|nr:DNA fragmentation factor subunit beta isoform X1 [Hippopotamus amphibius kiboko]